MNGESYYPAHASRPVVDLNFRLCVTWCDFPKVDHEAENRIAALLKAKREGTHRRQLGN